ncbi:helix-turn-helix domain-containing protein [Nitrobacter sp. TKz-YC02]|uniref:helix-turn-helix domain-containing protein n=1 Tax=Nitrobacter sp. TKz-YC02 TaxID=3398704 RepID=UPI003CF328DC
MSGRKILKGLTEAVAHARGEATNVRERSIHIEDSVDVRNIRKKLSLTQQEFSLQFGFSLAAVRHWEQGSRIPEMSARVLLTLIDKDPDYVRRALGMTDEEERAVVCG